METSLITTEQESVQSPFLNQIRQVKKSLPLEYLGTLYYALRGAPRAGSTSHTLGNVMTLSGRGHDSQMLSIFLR